VTLWQNFALNVAEHGFSIAVNNRSHDKVDTTVKRAQEELGDKVGNLKGCANARLRELRLADAARAARRWLRPSPLARAPLSRGPAPAAQPEPIKRDQQRAHRLRCLSDDYAPRLTPATLLPPAATRTPRSSSPPLPSRVRSCSS
jgi:IS5 family transposase